LFVCLKKKIKFFSVKNFPISDLTCNFFSLEWRYKVHRKIDIKPSQMAGFIFFLVLRLSQFCYYLPTFIWWKYSLLFLCSGDVNGEMTYRLYWNFIASTNKVLLHHHILAMFCSLQDYAIALYFQTATAGILKSGNYCFSFFSSPSENRWKEKTSKKSFFVF